MRYGGGSGGGGGGGGGVGTGGGGGEPTEGSSEGAGAERDTDVVRAVAREVAARYANSHAARSSPGGSASDGAAGKAASLLQRQAWVRGEVSKIGGAQRETQPAIAEQAQQHFGEPTASFGHSLGIAHGFATPAGAIAAAQARRSTACTSVPALTRETPAPALTPGGLGMYVAMDASMGGQAMDETSPTMPRLMRSPASAHSIHFLGRRASSPVPPPSVDPSTALSLRSRMGIDAPSYNGPTRL